MKVKGLGIAPVYHRVDCSVLWPHYVIVVLFDAVLKNICHLKGTGSFLSHCFCLVCIFGYGSKKISAVQKA